MLRMIQSVFENRLAPIDQKDPVQKTADNTTAYLFVCYMSGCRGIVCVIFNRLRQLSEGRWCNDLNDWEWVRFPPSERSQALKIMTAVQQHIATIPILVNSRCLWFGLIVARYFKWNHRLVLFPFPRRFLFLSLWVSASYRILSGHALRMSWDTVSRVRELSRLSSPIIALA